MHSKDLNKAKMLLIQTGCTCVLCNDQIVLTDNRRGVRPLLDLLEAKTDVVGFAAADKVVGKAAAFLYCLLGIRCIYAPVISQPALQVLNDAGIDVECDHLVSAIRNRTGDGFCPMETAVWNIQDPAQALAAILETLKKL